MRKKHVVRCAEPLPIGKESDPLDVRRLVVVMCATPIGGAATLNQKLRDAWALHCEDRSKSTAEIAMEVGLTEAEVSERFEVIRKDIEAGFRRKTAFDRNSD